VGEKGSLVVRISAIFIALCMVLIATSLGVVLHLHFGLAAADSAVVALGVLTALAVYNAIAGRKRDRVEVSDQVADLARGSADLARQIAEFGRRLGVAESKVESVLDKALSSAQPLATEVEELSRLVNQLAESVALHDAALARQRADDRAAPPATVTSFPAAIAATPTVIPAAGLVPAGRTIAAFKGLTQDAIVAVVRGAVEAQRIDLYLQPIVTLPQRRVRYYEAVSRLKTGNGEIVAAADFLSYAEAAALLPTLDNLSVLRCVQVVRRLLLKNRDVGLFCNLSVASLIDAGFPQLLEFIEANRAIAPSLVFEFAQSAVRAMGPIEHESLAALAERGFRFSMDNLSDLRVEPRELTERGFRFIKVPAALLLNRIGSTATNIHPADFSDLLGRFGIDLIAERIESEATVVDLLDYDVRFGQGFLFSPPRPVRAEALQGLGGDAGKSEPSKIEGATGSPGSAPQTGGGAQLARSGGGRN
jgi:cyclic-di-GMP phosphodiesterase, flagellum assembly factor TipF